MNTSLLDSVTVRAKHCRDAHADGGTETFSFKDKMEDMARDRRLPQTNGGQYIAKINANHCSRQLFFSVVIFSPLLLSLLNKGA